MRPKKGWLACSLKWQKHEPAIARQRLFAPRHNLCLPAYDSVWAEPGDIGQYIGARRCRRLGADLVSVVHAHPVHSTAVAIQRRAIPACHYMVAAFGGNDVPLVDYSLFGGEDLAQGVAAAMAHRSACILANHGAIAAGETLDKAMWRMQELETLAQMYLLSQIGADPVILSEQNIKDAVAAFANYGPRTVPKT